MHLTLVDSVSAVFSPASCSLQWRWRNSAEFSRSSVRSGVRSTTTTEVLHTPWYGEQVLRYLDYYPQSLSLLLESFYAAGDLGM
jgi:hypothetical protein